MGVQEAPRPYYETADRLEAAAELSRHLLGDPRKIKGRFLSYFAYHLTGQKENRALFKLPGSVSQAEFEVTQIALDSANVLNSLDWEIVPTALERGKLLLSPGRHPNVRIIASFLQGKSLDQVAYELRHRGREVSTSVLSMLQEDLMPFIVKRDLKTPKGLAPDDILPYVKDYDLASERYLPLWEAALAEAQKNTATYGGLNADNLYPQVRETIPLNGHYYAKAEIVPEEDQELNLRMPAVWYFNTGKENIMTALYYVHLQGREYHRFVNVNADLRRELGTVGLVEVYQVEKLQQFAESEGYRVFGTPYDLVVTANAISKNIVPAYVKEEAGFREFQESIISFWAKDQGMTFTQAHHHLACLEDKEREAIVLHMVKDYWQNVLLPRGWKQEDQEMILLDPKFSYGSEGRLSTDRRPTIVFIGGNNDVNFYNLHPMVYLEKNLGLARNLYPEDTRLISPAYKDETGHVFLAKVTKEPKMRFSLDALLLAMLTVRELGSKQTYRDLRSRYEELTNNGRGGRT